MRKLVVVCCLALLSACGNPTSGRKQTPRWTAAELVARAETVTPPFELKGEAEGLMLVWYDEQGAPHVGKRRSDVPEAQRAFVRVDSLDLPETKRLDPAFLYVADLRAPGAGGKYVIKKLNREAFELAMSAGPVAGDHDTALAAASDSVIIYGASWCGACKSAAHYLEDKGVPFVEKDIERSPEARSEMIAKAEAQGVSASGIPVIDVYGTVMGGFDRGRMDQLLARK